MSSTSSLPPPPTTTTTTTTPLETLLPHLLASKRSLSSITHVYRANELCVHARLALETTAVTTARTAFLCSGITSQVGLLQHVHSGIQNTARQSREEFEAVVVGLDGADARLKGMLERLRGTGVEAGLRPEGEERRSLLDFVDEGGVEGLMGGIKGVVGEAGEGFREFQEGVRSFREEIVRVKETLNTDRGSMGGSGELAVGEERSPIPDVLHEMENHARDMAGELEGLVKHYDLCVTALKHTEGGGDVALKFAGDLPEGMDIGQDAGGGTPEPIGDEQREEIMRVLEEDAEHVEGAVMDIRSHIADMETLYEQVEVNTEYINKEHASTTAAFTLLEDIGRKLPSYVTQSQVFAIRWDAEKAKVEELLEELEGLTEFYDGFLRAYDNLLIEIGRRKNVETKMEKEVQQARARLEKIYEDELAEREAFGKEQGDFLPVDIWPGLTAGPLRFELTSVEGEVLRVPDISKSVIHRAIRRVHGEQ